MMMHTHPVIDGDNHFIIDPITRAVTNAESKKTILMQNDHNSERFTFEIDKMVEGHDMTKCNKVEIHYTNEDSNKKNKNAGVYEVSDMQASEDNSDKLIFSWLVSENATLYAGSLRFLIVFSCVEHGDVTYRWNTNINTSISISKGMNNGEAIEGAYPDILTQWKSELFAALHGMETTHVGPDEPDTYPYIWFDTSEYPDQTDPYVGVIRVKDADGNEWPIYPFTKLAGTDGASFADQFDDIVKSVDELAKGMLKTEDVAEMIKDKIEADDVAEMIKDKVNVDDIANDLTTEDEGRVLDARQGKALAEMIGQKATVIYFQAGLPYDRWSDTIPYTQTVEVEGVLASDTPIVDMKFYETDSVEMTLERLRAWSLVTGVVAGDGTLTLYCYEAKPDFTWFAIKGLIVR